MSVNKGYQTTAIISTIRNAEAVIDSFIQYHLSAGFDLIYLFLDDPNEPYVASISKYDKVILIKNDEALKDLWKATRSYNALKGFQGEIMARQTLNVEVGIKLAFQKKVDWILHIDCDELFYLRGQTIQEHFRTLAASDIKTFTYINYESVPEVCEIKNPFTEVTLFKKNFRLLSQRQKQSLSQIATENPDKVVDFIAYGIGKSAGKVSRHLAPQGVHFFQILPSLNWSYCKYMYKNLLKKLEKRRRGKLYDPLERNSPIILHYPCCGFNTFWKKFMSFGAFPDYWFGKYPIIKQYPFLIHGRDVVKQGNEELARGFYSRFIFGDYKAINFLIEEGVFCRITDPSECLLTSTKNESLNEKAPPKLHLR